MMERALKERIIGAAVLVIFVASGTLGNPNLQPETTISYQAALQHQFNDFLAAQFAVYNRDIFGLIAGTQVIDETTLDVKTTRRERYVANWTEPGYAAYAAVLSRLLARLVGDIVPVLRDVADRTYKNPPTGGG